MSRGLLPSLLINGLAPYLAYQLLKGRGIPSATALALTSVFPLAGLLIGWVRSRRADGIGILSLILILAGIAASLVSGDQRLYLLRVSVGNALFGLICLGSLLGPRPLLFYLGRQLATSGDPVAAARYDSRWEDSSFRHGQRVTTAVWGIASLIEAVARAGLASTLPIGTFLLVDTPLGYGVFVLLIIWTIHYWRRASESAESDEER